MPDSIMDRLDPDIVAAFDALGVRPTSVSAITTLPSTAANRASFRVTLADGGSAKAVLVESADRAGAIAQILDLLRHRHFARVLARHGRALVTEWIDGTPLVAASHAVLEDCGAILGSIHAVRLPPGLPLESCRYGEASSTIGRAKLDEVVQAGALDAATARAALQMAEKAAPRSAETGFVHRDFCPDNLVVDRRGLVHVVDNESLSCDALDYDLARWWYRWPLSTAERDSFLKGYSRYRSPSAFRRHFAFWMVHALVDSALFRLRNGTGHEGVPSAAIGELVRAAPVSSPRTPAAVPLTRRVFFASDLHLGVPGQLTSLDRERQLVAWLDLVEREASDLFLLGDLFDFWFEYKTVVPRGHTRVLGRLAALADAGVQVHIFAGNHDRWLGDYLTTEMRAQIYREPQVMRLHGRTFYLAHGAPDDSQTARERLAGSSLVRHALAVLHPDLGISIVRALSARSRAAKSQTRASGATVRKSPQNRPARKGEAGDGDAVLLWQAHRIRLLHPDVEFIVLGHRHRPELVQFAESAWCVDVGDWLSHRSYAVFDGVTIELCEFR